VGYVPQLETVDWNFPITVEQLVLLGKIKSAGPWPWPRQADRQQMAQILDRLGIAELATATSAIFPEASSSGFSWPGPSSLTPTCSSWMNPPPGVDIQSAENILRLLAELKPARHVDSDHHP